jgi:hypothetical protein
MDKCLSLLIVIIVIFVLTYNPKTGNLEQYILNPKSPPQEPQKPCCSDTDYRADHPVQCRASYYQGLQFGDPNYGCPVREPAVCQGAIIGT